MGTFKWPLRIAGMDGQQGREVEATVDTGAAYTTLPASLLRELGIEPMDKGVFLLARRSPCGDGHWESLGDGQRLQRGHSRRVRRGQRPGSAGSLHSGGVEAGGGPYCTATRSPPISLCTRRLRRPPRTFPSCTTAISGSRDLHRPPPLSPTPHQSTPSPPSSPASARGDAARLLLHVGADGDAGQDAQPLQGPPCDVQAYRTAWSAPGRLQAPVLRASAVCCFRSFRWYLSYCVVAAAGGGPLASRHGIAAGPPEPTERAGAGGIQPSQAPPCRRCACARRGRLSSCPP